MSIIANGKDIAAAYIGDKLVERIIIGGEVRFEAYNLSIRFASGTKDADCWIALGHDTGDYNLVKTPITKLTGDKVGQMRVPPQTKLGGALWHNKYIISVDKFPDLTNVTTLKRFIVGDVDFSQQVERIVLNQGRTKALTSVEWAFGRCKKLTYLDVSALDPTHITEYTNMLTDTPNIKTIRCTAAFRDWCIAKATSIALPTAFRKSSYSGWEIVE